MTAKQLTDLIDLYEPRSISFIDYEDLDAGIENISNLAVFTSTNKTTEESQTFLSFSIEKSNTSTQSLNKGFFTEKDTPFDLAIKTSPVPADQLAVSVHSLNTDDYEEARIIGYAFNSGFLMLFFIDKRSEPAIKNNFNFYHSTIASLMESMAIENKAEICIDFTQAYAEVCTIALAEELA